MGRAVSWMDRAWYGDQPGGWDNDALRAIVLADLETTDTVLDLGAGAGYVRQMDLRGHVARVCGVDPSSDVLRNPLLDEAKVAGGESIPYDSDLFDAVVSNNVFEHLSEPLPVLREVDRVLKPGGRFYLKTPNRWHYVAAAASCTPHSFHRWWNSLRGRPERHTFPTHYRANSRRALRRLAAAAGLEVERLAVIEGRPEYLRVHPALYVAGFIYERIVNATRLLEGFRCVLISVLRKPSRAPATSTGAPGVV